MNRVRLLFACVITAALVALAVSAPPVRATVQQVVDSIVATTCTNQFVRSITATGSANCAAVANADLANSATTVAGQTCTLGSTCGLSTASNALGADVLLNNTANYFDGPSMAQGTTGTWFASGSVGIIDTAGAAAVLCKLWDGTTVIADGQWNMTAANTPLVATLSGYLVSPAANIRISCRDATSTSGKIQFNNVGNSKGATVYGIRIN